MKKKPSDDVVRQVDESIKGVMCSCCTNLLQDFDTYCVEEGWHPLGKIYNLCEPHVRYLLRDIRTFGGELRDPKFPPNLKEYDYLRIKRINVVRLSTKDSKRVPLHGPTTRHSVGEPW